ncbi:Probable purine permease 4 [Linum perenne]
MAQTQHTNTPLLLANYILLFAGTISSTLLSRYYFIHKGSDRWVSTVVQTAAFPLLLLPIYLPYYLFRSTTRPPFANFTPKLFLTSVFVGLLLGLNNLLFSWGNSFLPVSTSSLLLSTQLLFNLLFSFMIVDHKVNFHNLNSVVLLSLSSVLLGLGSEKDSATTRTEFEYYVGFGCTIGAGLMFALYLPLMERIYRKVVDCYAMVVEMQAVMEAAATAFAVAGMAASGGGVSEMRKESEEVFDKGKVVYWMTVVGNAATWQLCFMGTAGMVYLTSSVTGGICMTALLGMNVISGVIVYGEAFGGVKAVSTALCIWGFSSYVYGMYSAAEVAKLTAENNNNNNNNNINNDDGGDRKSAPAIQMVPVDAAGGGV